MNPTKQTVLHDPDNNKFGNCFSAVLASLLHLPIEDVPLFKGDRWTQELNAWLKPYGLAFIQFGGFDEWAADMNISDCYHDIGGTTTRSHDVLHGCVGKDGHVVFDPHPDNTGLVEKTGHGLFISLQPWITAHAHKA